MIIFNYLNYNLQFSFPEFHSLINNAGIMAFGEFEWQTERMFLQQFNVNVLGPMKITHNFLPLLRKHGGRLINICSHCSLQPLPGLAAYSASKAALKFWTEGLRMELSKYGVKVIAFIPGNNCYSFSLMNSL